ncbi:MAG TPA: class II aldolase/adducin family protein [Actinomycetes bacterium]|nr:class II aldolase/adducin family protein [Actinomycetes bacterium]
MRLQALRAAIADAGRELERARLVEGTSGNLSARDPGGGTVAVTPGSLEYRRIHAADVLLVGGDGRLLEAPHGPSSELSMHLAVYRARRDVGAVVHTHSPWATTWAVLGREIPAVHYVIASIGYSIRVAPYATFGTEQLARNVVSTLGGDNAVLLASHGVVAVGADLRSAIENAVRVEFLAEVYWKATRIGAPVVLAPEEIDRVRAQAAAKRAGGSIRERLAEPAEGARDA